MKAFNNQWSTAVGTVVLLLLICYPISLSGRSKPPVDPTLLKVRQIYTSQIGIREQGYNAGKQVESYLRYVNLPKGNPWCAAFVCWVLGRAGVENPRTGWSPAMFSKSNVIWDRTARSSRLPVSGFQFSSSERQSFAMELGGFNILQLGQMGSNPHSPLKPKNPRLTTTLIRQPATGNLQPSSGDIFGIYFPEKNRIAHAGFIDSWDGKWLITVEGNTNESGSREGDGVYRKRRLVSSISKVARYINLERRVGL